MNIATWWRTARTSVHRALIGGLALSVIPVAVSASPWVEVGDDLVRRDVEILAGFGLMDGLTTTWPIPWKQVSKAFERAEGKKLPQSVRNALLRLRGRYSYEAKIGTPRVEARAQMSNEPRLVRGFRDTGRDEIDLEFRLEYMWESTAIRLNAGILSDFKFDDVSANLDRSYIAQELGGWLLYAGTIEEWWGSGNVSSLIRSNNARPHPRVGVMRNDTSAFDTPWLSWIGPWQLGTSVGWLDDDRAVENALLWDMHLSFQPVQGLQFSFYRSIMLCGEDQSCSLGTWSDAFRGLAVGDDANQLGGGNAINQLAGADVRYATPIGENLAAIYGQYVAEDKIDGWPGKAGWLGGASLAGYSAAMLWDWQIAGEISDTRARLNGGNPPYENTFYNHFIYRNGYRYRGRSLGHSLDNDAMLYSVVGQVVDASNWRWRGALHRAELNRDGTVRATGGNTVSGSDETIHVAEAGVEVPIGPSLVSLDLTVQDDRPDTPGDKEWLVTAYGSWRLRF